MENSESPPVIIIISWRRDGSETVRGPRLPVNLSHGLELVP